MSDQVFRYNSKEDCFDPYVSGKAVSAKFDTEEEALKVRDLLREGEDRFYYDVKHLTQVATIDSDSGPGTRTTSFEYPPASAYEHQEVGE